MSFRDFNAYNGETSSRTLFNERGKYNNEGIPLVLEQRFPGIFRNFWFAENMYYGRIDRFHKFIILKEEKLRQINSVEGSTLQMVDFAADALDDFMKQHRKALSASKIQKTDELLSEVVPFSGHTALLTSYDLHMTTIRDTVHAKMVRSIDQVENFDDFVRFFIRETASTDQPQPLTLTGFVASRMCSPFTTGLFVDLVKADTGDDRVKIRKIVDRPNFQFIADNARKHGLMIDYNIPMRLCANLGSPEMERYMSAYGTNSNTVFDDYYSSIYDVDHVYLMNYLKKFYNRFVRLRPNIRKEQLLNKKVNKVYRYVTKRKILTQYELSNRYGVEYRIDLYTDLRNRESGGRYSQALLDTIKRNAKFYNASSGVSRALQYIDYQFIGLNDPGAYNAFLIKAVFG